jgi:hypothetical protein
MKGNVENITMLHQITFAQIYKQPTILDSLCLHFTLCPIILVELTLSGLHAGEWALDPMQMLDDNMTQSVQRASVRNPQAKSTALQCFSCGCEEGICFVVMKKKSVQKMKQQGRCIKCPIHHSTSTSTYARRFYDAVRALDVQVRGIVWDWFDVPDDENSNHKMHIDASVFCEASCIRFEIDGETHFHNSGTSRNNLDEQKDALLREHSVDMVRLHYMDAERWGEYVMIAVTKTHGTVRYTGSYRHCLHPSDYKYIIWLQ